MTAEDNTATYRRWFDEGCSRGNVDLADELYSPDYVTHSVGPDFRAGLPSHPGGLKMFIRALREGLPDLHCPVDMPANIPWVRSSSNFAPSSGPSP